MQVQSIQSTGAQTCAYNCQEQSVHTLTGFRYMDMHNYYIQGHVDAASRPAFYKPIPAHTMSPNHVMSKTCHSALQSSKPKSLLAYVQLSMNFTRPFSTPQVVPQHFCTHYTNRRKREPPPVGECFNELAVLSVVCVSGSCNIHLKYPTHIIQP